MRPAPSCARPCSGAAHRSRRPCRSSERARGALRRRLLVPVRDGALEPSRHRLDRRAVAQVLEPLAGGDAHPLLLLLDVRHSVKTPAARADTIVAKPNRALFSPSGDDQVGSYTRPRGAALRRPSARVVRGHLRAGDRAVPHPRARPRDRRPPTSSARAGRSTRSRSRSRCRTRFATSWPTRPSHPSSSPSSASCWRKGRRSAPGGWPRRSSG